MLCPKGRFGPEPGHADTDDIDEADDAELVTAIRFDGDE